MCDTTSLYRNCQVPNERIFSSYIKKKFEQKQRDTSVFDPEKTFDEMDNNYKLILSALYYNFIKLNENAKICDSNFITLYDDPNSFMLKLNFAIKHQYILFKINLKTYVDTYSNYFVDFEYQPKFAVYGRNNKFSIKKKNDSDNRYFAVLNIDFDNPVNIKLSVKHEDKRVLIDVPFSYSYLFTYVEMDLNTFVEKWNKITDDRHIKKIEFPYDNRTEHELPMILETIFGPSNGKLIYVMGYSYECCAALSYTNVKETYGVLIRAHIDLNRSIMIEIKGTNEKIVNNLSFAVSAFV